MAVSSAPTIETILTEEGLRRYRILRASQGDQQGLEPWPTQPALPGYVSDLATGPDQLGFAADVNSLCMVIAARDVQPPLSIGLFGDWGTGKSFFMAQMQERIRAITAASQQAKTAGKETAFCTHIKQITFNAWHYADTNLWASLVTRVFEGLAAPDSTGAYDARTTDNTRAALVRELETSKEMVAAEEVKKEQAQSKRADLEKELNRVQSDRNDKANLLASVKASDVVNILSDPEIQQAAESVKEQLGVSIDISPGDVPKIARELRDLPTIARYTWRLLGGRKRIVFVLLALASALVIIGLVRLLGAADWVRGLGALAVAFVVVVTNIVAFLRRPFEEVRAAARTAQDAVTNLEERKQAALAEKRNRLNDDIARLQQEESKLEIQIERWKLRVRQAEEEIADIQSGRRLSKFIHERSATTDYKEFLGIIALIRRDFDRLEQLLKEAQADPEKAGAGLPVIDRVVLYIDDLDRCPADRVVHVLEAIHLLLAFELFVVVVGVDSRWLVGSLRRHYVDELSAGTPNSDGLKESESEWVSAPQNYLEKIFQIPIAVPAMEPDGFERLVGSLFENRTQASKSQPTESRLAAMPAGGSPEQSQELPVEQSAASQAAVDLEPENLGIIAPELAFMKTLAPMVPTPRAAKRLANTYRLIRASLSGDALRRLLGADGSTPEYRIVLLLLAVLIGEGPGASEFFDDLLGQPAGTTWRSFVATSRTRSPQLGEFLDSLLNPFQESFFSVEPFQQWGRRVVRYSFSTIRASGLPGPQVGP